MGNEYVMMNVKLPAGTSYVRTEVTEEGLKIFCVDTAESIVNNTESIEATTQKNDVFRWIDTTEIKKYDFGRERENRYEEKLRQNILNARENYTSKGFYPPIYEPSLDADGNIQFVAGATPAEGHSSVWWNENGEKFCPERDSRQGTDEEYYLFIGYLIKEGHLTWEQAAVDSRSVGNYLDSPNSPKAMEKTGTRSYGGFYGFVGNTCKYVKQAKASGYALMGGSCDYYGSNGPVADACTIITSCDVRNNSVGWLVLHK